MLAIARRNVKLFFRDKGGVFFSLMSVFIVLGLYALFLKSTILGGDLEAVSYTHLERRGFKNAEGETTSARLWRRLPTWRGRSLLALQAAKGGGRGHRAGGRIGIPLRTARANLAEQRCANHF